jgi:hypothetical protein
LPESAIEYTVPFIGTGTDARHHLDGLLLPDPTGRSDRHERRPAQAKARVRQ